MIVGVTGSIGSGKTTFADILVSKHGWKKFDADSSAKLSLVDNYTELSKMHPECFVNGELNRQAFANVLFTNTKLRQWVADRVYESLCKLIDALVEQHPNDYYILDVPLLFESGLDRKCECTIVVTAPDELRQQRAMARSQMTEEDFKQRDAVQMSQSEKEDRATFVVENDLELHELEQQAEAIVVNIMTQKNICPRCNGWGADRNAPELDCPQCNGSGDVL